MLILRIQEERKILPTIRQLNKHQEKERKREFQEQGKIFPNETVVVETFKSISMNLDWEGREFQALNCLEAN